MFRGRSSADARRTLTVEDMEALQERGQTFSYVHARGEQPRTGEVSAIKIRTQLLSAPLQRTSSRRIFTVENGRFFYRI